MLSHFSRVQLCSTLWTTAHQAVLSVGFSRQEYWSGLPFPSPCIALDLIYDIGLNISTLWLYFAEEKRIHSDTFFKKKKDYFWLRWVFVAVQAFLSLREAGATRSLGGLLCYGVYCCGEQALGYSGFRRCGFQALEHRFDSFGTWVSCSTTRRIRDWTCVSCIGRWILNHGPQGSPTLVLSTAIIILNKFHITLVSPASSILGEWGNTSSYLILTSLEQSSLNTSIPTHVSFPQQPYRYLFAFPWIP